MKAELPVLVVRLTTNAFYNKHQGLVYARRLKKLARKSSGIDFMEEDCACVGAEDFANYITNLHSCQDGIYRLVVTEETRDWETGIVDDWKYKLIPEPTASPCPSPTGESE